MKFLYYIIAFIAISLTANVQGQQQQLIPVTVSTNINTELTQTAQPTHTKINKKRKFKRNFVRHPKFKKVCIYGGFAIGGIIAGICLFTFGLPIIISTILIGIEIFVRIKGSLIKIRY